MWDYWTLTKLNEVNVMFLACLRVSKFNEEMDLSFSLSYVFSDRHPYTVTLSDTIRNQCALKRQEKRIKWHFDQFILWCIFLVFILTVTL